MQVTNTQAIYHQYKYFYQISEDSDVSNKHKLVYSISYDDHNSLVFIIW